MLECYTKNIARAKNRHTCSICGAPIEVNEKYVAYRGKTDGEWFRDSYHLVCQNIIDNFLDDTGEDEYSFAEIDEWLHDLKCHECDKHNKETNDCECYNIGFPIRCPKVRKYFEEEDAE